MFSPRVAWSLAFGCVAWQGVARIGQMLDVATTHGAGSVPQLVTGASVIGGLVVAQLFLSVARGPQHLLLVAMAAGTLAPILLLGGAWPAIAGLVGAAILLTLHLRLSALLVAMVLGADATLYWQFSELGGAVLASRILMNVNVALLLTMVIRMARSIQQTHDARVTAVRAVVEAEKQRSAQWLRSSLGSCLAELIAATRDMSSTPSGTAIARDDVVDVARASHRAAETARHALGPPGRGYLPSPAAEETTSTNDYALSWAASLLITVIFGVVALLNLLWLTEPTTGTWVTAIIVAFSSTALHLYHGTPRADGSAPRWWPWTVITQALLVVPAVWAAGEPLLLPYIALAAGSAATRLHAPWLWVLPPGAFILGPVIAASVSPSWNAWASANMVGNLATVIIALYALCHLPWVAALLNRTRAQYAWTAMSTERSNFARDVHDLLGFHLSAMVLNAELALRTRVEDPPAARERLDTVRLCAQRAMGDLRSIHDDAGLVSTEHEVAEAASMLRAAGVQVTVEVPQGASGRPDHIAGIVVREASTNIVRHAQARRCSFRLDVGADGDVELEIINDGARFTVRESVPEGAPSTGRGLGNLTARVEEAGGLLTTTHSHETFRLTVQIPAHGAGADRDLAGAGTPRLTATA